MNMTSGQVEAQVEKPAVDLVLKGAIVFGLALVETKEAPMLAHDVVVRPQAEEDKKAEGSKGECIGRKQPTQRRREAANEVRQHNRSRPDEEPDEREDDFAAAYLPFIRIKQRASQRRPDVWSVQDNRPAGNHEQPQRERDLERAKSQRDQRIPQRVGHR